MFHRQLSEDRGQSRAANLTTVWRRLYQPPNQLESARRGERLYNAF